MIFSWLLWVSRIPVMSHIPGNDVTMVALLPHHLSDTETVSNDVCHTWQTGSLQSVSQRPVSGYQEATDKNHHNTTLPPFRITSNRKGNTFNGKKQKEKYKDMGNLIKKTCLRQGRGKRVSPTKKSFHYQPFRWLSWRPIPLTWR